MTLHRPLQIVSGLVLLFTVAVGVTSINHPIILKWVTGSAKHHGKPIPATVYANGQVTNDIKVFYTDEANKYLLSLTQYDSSGILTLINIDLNERSIGRPAATTKNDYDFIAGHLFQSKDSEQFFSFQDETNSVNFDPLLKFAERQITFNMPPNKLELDSIRIILPW